MIALISYLRRDYPYRSFHFIYHVMRMITFLLLFSASLSYGQINEEWVARYDGLGNFIDDLYDMAVDINGNIYVTGESFESNTNTGYNFVTIKYDSNGTELWLKIYAGQGSVTDKAIGLVVDDQENVYVTGESIDSTNLNWQDYFTVKYDINGDVVWVESFSSVRAGKRSPYGNH